MPSGWRGARGSDVTEVTIQIGEEDGQVWLHVSDYEVADEFEDWMTELHEGFFYESIFPDEGWKFLFGGLADPVKILASYRRFEAETGKPSAKQV